MMRAGWFGLVWLLLAFALPAHAEERAPEDAALLTVTAEPSTCVVGQPVDVTLQVRYLAEHFEAHAATLFRRPLDLEVQLTAPWLSALDGATVLSSDALGVNVGPGDWVRLAVNGEVTSLPRAGPELKDGLSWHVLTTRCRIVPTKTGTLQLAPPILKYAYATAIEVNLMGERTARDSRPVTIEGVATSVVVTDPPTAGRPEDFTGAVGRFGVEARVETPEVEVGTPFELTLLITGEGNLGLIEQPRLPDMLGFHVYGAKEAPIDEPNPARRVIRYEVAVTAGGIGQVPAIPFSYYDPSTGYATARTAPIALRVTGGEATSVATGVGDSVDRPVASREARDDRTPPLAFLGFAILAGLLVIGGGVAMLIRMRPRPAVAPPVRRIGTPPIKPKPTPPPPRPSPAAALAALRAAIDSGDEGAQFRTFADYLAARLGCGPGSVAGPGLRDGLLAAGVSADVTQAAVTAMEKWVDARYGGREVVTFDGSLVDQLEAAFTSGQAPAGSSAHGEMPTES